MMSKRVALIGILVLVVAVTAVSQRTRNSGASSPINENALRAHVKFLSDDRLEGRGTGAKGGETAALYIASQFEAMGLQGVGPKGSYWQPVSLVGVKADPKTELRVSGGNKAESFKFGDDFVAFTGAQTERVNADAELVFVGYGIEAPEQKWNDYKGSAEDYRGKILVMMVNDPPATTQEPNLFGAKALTYYGRWTYKFEEAARRGAVGVILLHTTESAGYGWNVVRTSNGSWRFDIARTGNDKTPFLKIRSWITDEAAHKLFAMAGLNVDDLRKQAASRDFTPVKMNLTASLDLNSEVKRVEAPNVVAVIPGRDPKLRDEYVVITAHWDHLGIGTPNKQGDTIYNGALDNATGIASVLEIARVLTQLPVAEKPRRSILFLMTTAEEQGLIGAEWYTRYPLVPIAKTAANVNLDSMNILGPTANFVPLGAERSTLKAVVDAVARERGLRVSPDPRPEQGSFYRSDHFPFAKVGVPSISLKEGDEYIGHPKDWGVKKFQEYNQAHYHQPSDEFRENEWNFKGMIQEADFAMALVRRIADLPAMPKFNPDDEFAKNSRR